MDDILKLTLTETVSALHERKLSPVDLMEATLARIDEVNPDLNAIVARREAGVCMSDARAAKEALARGQGRPLEGVPIGVKDLEHAAGLFTTEGSLLFKDRVSDHDSVLVSRFKAAGAIVIGKTNVPEFGAPAFTRNPVYGTTRSPWNLKLTPGGSSGGSAAALASGALSLVTASDGGGSIRIPASFVGAFGLKPSYGRVPRGPAESWEYGDTGCWGPLTKTVEDAATWLDQVVGASVHDPNSLPHPGYRYADRLKEPLPEKMHIGVVADLGYAVVQADVAKSVEEAAGDFSRMGHTLRRVIGGPPEMAADWSHLGAFFSAARLSQYIGTEQEQLIGHGYLAGIRGAWKMSPERWQKASEARAALNAWCATVFDRFDLIITPTVPYDPFDARGGYPQQIEGRPANVSGVGSFTIPFNLSWHPAATVRCGISQKGLPIGLQIVGPRHRDDLVLQAALAFERVKPAHPKWPYTWEPL